MDGTTPLVSVIMSVYNGEQWLSRAIDSIIQQTYTNWEFIIIDDASNEATQNILNQYITDKRIKLLRQKSRQGLTKNLNRAIELCNGEFIARMDADDISLSTRFEKQVSYLQSKPVISVVASFINMIDEKDQPIGIWPDDRKTIYWKNIKTMLPWNNCIAHPTIMARNTILKRYRYNEEQTHSQDWDLWLRLADDDKIIEKMPEPLLLYRVHSGSITRQSNKKSAFLKKNEVYKKYLEHSKFNSFNTKVWAGFLFNRIKLFLSPIKKNSS